MIVPIFILVATAFWLFVTGLIALIGGWYFTARAFPLPERSLGQGAEFTFQSVSIGILGNYRSCIHLTAGEEGVIMRPFILYRFLHRPIFIPWGAMTDPAGSDFLMFKGVSFRAGNRKITVRGSAAEEFRKRLSIP